MDDKYFPQIFAEIQASVRVEPTNAACAHSTATSIKDEQVAYITKPDAAVHSV